MTGDPFGYDIPDEHQPTFLTEADWDANAKAWAMARRMLIDEFDAQRDDSPDDPFA